MDTREVAGDMFGVDKGRGQGCDGGRSFLDRKFSSVNRATGNSGIEDYL